VSLLEKKLRIAIVGSEGKYWTPEERTKAIAEIVKIFRKHATNYNDGNVPEFDYNMTLISGGCGYENTKKRAYIPPGIDEWAEIVADVLGIKKDIRYAPAGQWNDKLDVIYETDRGNLEENLKGYRTRNTEIAEMCDILYCIDPKWRGEKTGGQWTMRYAQKARKEVHLVQIE